VSAENVDKVRRIYEAFGTREWDTGFAIRFVHLWRFRAGKVVCVYDCAGESRRP
jgi:hypothetical protein